MGSQRRRKAAPLGGEQPPSGPPQPIPEWIEHVRLTVEREVPIMQALMMRAINAVLRFDALSEESVVNATTAPTDLAVLLRALSSGELLEDLTAVEPLAPAFIRGIQAKRRLLEEHGGTLTAEQVANVLGVTRQAVDKRRRAGKLIALDDVLLVLATHDEWMQTAFFVSENPRLDNRTPIEMLNAGKLELVLNAAEVYGEHGAA